MSTHPAFVLSHARARRWYLPLCMPLLATLLIVPAVFAEGGVTLQDIATDPDSGLAYQRAPSATVSIAESFRARGTVPMSDFAGGYPIKSFGAPGVVLLDHDGDGDDDVFVTNGPGAANSLFENLFIPTGVLRFADVASATGVGLPAMDATGACAGDIDNDGDPDLYVLGRGEDNHLLENLGGVFQDVTSASGTGGGASHSMSCSFGDVTGDGLLDLVVGNTFDMASSAAIFLEPFALNQRNLLFVNTGGLQFVDRSASSGVADATDITWAIALVDLDEDGDLDISQANDNGAIPPAALGGVDRGFLRWLENDGSGDFTDRTAQAGLALPGDWMGLAYGDFNHDGLMDLFGSNSGDYFESLFGLPIPVGLQSTRWFFRQPDNTFADPGVGNLVATPFAWGAAALDYDNDGDTDILSYGGLDSGPLVEASNPGCLLSNDGTGRFSLDDDAIDTALHLVRTEHGLAVGDLNLDGFPDVVSVSSFNLPAPPVPVPFGFGSPFDALAGFFPTFAPTATPGVFTYTGARFLPGTVALEVNSGDNGNGWVAVKALGTLGLTSGGAVNRDGIGAVISVTPKNGLRATTPVLGGSSYASQHSLTRTFGLGDARSATVDVLWPGGVRNRLYHVRAGERLVLPEIPCSIDDDGLSFRQYTSCVRDALTELSQAGIVSPGERARLFSSAVRAFAQER